MGSFQKGDKLDTTKLRRVKFPLPELGDGKYITLRALAVQEFEEIRGKEDSPGKMSDGDYALLAKCCVTDDGSAIFDDAADVKQNLPIALETFLDMAVKIAEISGATKDRSKN